MVNFADKTGVLATLWIEFREDEDFSHFVSYNDIGLPMAYYVAEGLIKDLTPLGEQYISETFDMLSLLLNVTDEELSLLEDLTFDRMLEFAYIKKNSASNEDLPDA